MVARPLPPPRTMTVWRDARGQPVATISQGVAVKDGRLVAVYFAAIPGETQERKTYACAKRAIDGWVARARLQLVASHV